MILKKRFSPYLTIFLVFLLYIVLSGLCQILIFPIDDNSIKNYFAVLFVIVLYLFIVYYFNIFYFKKNELKPPVFLKFNSSLLKGVFFGVLIAFVTLFPTRFAAYFNSDDLEYLYVLITFKSIVINLFASVTEEIVFRGTVLNFFVQKDKKYLGLIITSAFFGALHMTNAFVGQEINFLYVLNLTVFGLLCGLIYLNFGIASVIIFHLTNNLLVNGFVKSAGGSNYILLLTLAVIIGLLYRDIKNNSGSIKVYKPN